MSLSHGRACVTGGVPIILGSELKTNLNYVGPIPNVQSLSGHHPAL